MDPSLWEFLLKPFSLQSLATVVIMLVALAAIMWPLEQLFPARKQATISRPHTRTDLIYWFFTPICTRFMTTLMVSAVIAGVFLLLNRPIDKSVFDGFGPIAQQPIWLQMIEAIIIGDFFDYWTHRIYHWKWFWRFHAVHHSPEHMDWLGYGRMHPLNEAGTRLFQVIPVMLLGFSPQAVIIALPVMGLYVIFLHSNIRWAYGPFKYVLVSPAYHRWHHSRDDEGVDVNFAGFFPIWDLLFGTFYMPKHLPKAYGVRKEVMPTTFWGQMLFPFRRIRYREQPQQTITQS